MKNNIKSFHPQLDLIQRVMTCRAITGRTYLKKIKRFSIELYANLRVLNGEKRQIYAQMRDNFPWIAEALKDNGILYLDWTFYNRSLVHPGSPKVKLLVERSIRSALRYLATHGLPKERDEERRAVLQTMTPDAMIISTVTIRATGTSKADISIVTDHSEPWFVRLYRQPPQ